MATKDKRGYTSEASNASEGYQTTWKSAADESNVNTMEMGEKKLKNAWT